VKGMGFLHKFSQVARNGWAAAGAGVEATPGDTRGGASLAANLLEQLELASEQQALPSIIGSYPVLNFEVLQTGDVLLQNTNGPPAAAGKAMGFSTSAGHLGMTHSCLCFQSRYNGHPNHALLWEMFETGAKIRPWQGSERLEEDTKEEYEYVPEDTAGNVAMVLRYLGPDREALQTNLKEIIFAWHTTSGKEITFPNKVSMGYNAMRQWYASTPTAAAFRFASYARSHQQGQAPEMTDSYDNSQYCSSLCCATLQGAFGALAPEGSPEEIDFLNRIPVDHAKMAPTDWSLLPDKSPYWKVLGVVTGFSKKRSYSWYCDQYDME